MAATLLLVNADLEFGVPVLSGCVLQNIGRTRTANTAKATGEQGDVIGISVYGGQDAEVDGDYLWLGSDFADVGDNIASDVGTALGVTGPVVVTGNGCKRAHEGFATGDLKAVTLDGASIV